MIIHFNLEEAAMTSHLPTNFVSCPAMQILYDLAVMPGNLQRAMGVCAPIYECVIIDIILLVRQ